MAKAYGPGRNWSASHDFQVGKNSVTVNNVFEIRIIENYSRLKRNARREYKQGIFIYRREF
jgi:hypothetical protein